MKTVDELGISPWPWRVETTEYPAEYGGGIADYSIKSKDEMYVDKYMNIRDARLISTAPELYEALAAMVECVEKNLPYMDMSQIDIAIDMAKKAIVKACGGGGEVMETINDILHEMRDGLKDAHGNSVGIYDELADRIETAYRRDHECAVEERAVLEREISSLKAALKPVLDIDTVKFAFSPTIMRNAIREAQIIYNKVEEK